MISLWWGCLSLAVARPSVVFVGNSYTERNELADVVVAMLDGMTYEQFVVESSVLASGGFNFDEHARSVGTRDEYRAVFRARHDWFLMQDQSQTPGFPEQEPAWVVSQRAAVELHEQAGLTGAVTMLFVTWGRRDGDEMNTSLYPDFPTMQDRLDAGYRAYAAAMFEDSGRQVWFAPVGAAFRSVYDEAATLGDPLADGSPFAALYAVDGSHPSREGTYLAASVIAASLTGRVPRGAMNGVGEAARRALQRHAEAVVTDDPFASDWSFPWTYELDVWLDKYGDVPISDRWASPTVRISTPVEDRTGWTVGGALDEGPGEGRLYVGAGGRLVAPDAVRIGHGGGGELVVAGGEVVVPELDLAPAAGDVGVVTVRDGRLEIDAVRVGEGLGSVVLRGGTLAAAVVEPSLVQAGGALEYGELLRLESDYRLTGGRLTLSGGGLIEVVGEAELGAEVSVSGELQAGEVLLRAGSLLTEGWTLVDLPTGLSLEVVDSGSGQELVVVGVDTESPTPGDPDPEAEGCGCAHGAGGGWLLGLGLVAARRRQRPALHHGSSSAAQSR